MLNLKRAKRVRIHFTAAAASAGAESVEGLLVSRRHHEYVIAAPEFLLAAGGKPQPLQSAQLLIIPKAHVAHYELLR